MHVVGWWDSRRRRRRQQQQHSPGGDCQLFQFSDFGMLWWSDAARGAAGCLIGYKALELVWQSNNAALTPFGT